MTNRDLNRTPEIRAELQKLKRSYEALKARKDTVDPETYETLKRKIAHKHRRLVAELKTISAEAAPRHEKQPDGEPEVSVADADLPRRNRLRSRTPVLITAIVLILFIGGFSALRIINSRAGSEVEAEITARIREFELQDSISFGDVRVDAARGRITISDVSFESANPRTRAGAAEVVVDLGRDNFLQVARNPETAVISSVSLTARSASVNDTREDISLGAESISVGMTGVLPLGSEIDAAQILRIESYGTRLQNATFRLGDPEVSGSLDSFVYEMTGSFEMQDWIMSFEPMAGLEILDSLRIELSGAQIVPGQVMLTELMDAQLLLDEQAWIADPDNWSIGQSVLSVSFRPDAVVLDSLSLQTPFIEANGHGEMQFNLHSELQSIGGELTVHNVIRELRDAFRPILFFMTGTDLPDNDPFTVSFFMDETEIPVFEIR